MLHKSYKLGYQQGIKLIISCTEVCLQFKEAGPEQTAALHAGLENKGGKMHFIFV